MPDKTNTPELPPLTDSERQTVMQCADLFFSQTGTVQECVARVAFAAFRAGADRGRGEPVATVEVIEVNDPHLRPAHHVALHKLLPHGTKLYAVRAAMGGDAE